MISRAARTLSIVGAIGAAVMLTAGCASNVSAPGIVGSWESQEPGNPSLTFTEDGKVSGTDGCNDINSTYTIDGESIIVQPFASTRMFCEGVNTWLSGLATATIDGKTLLVQDASGTPIGELTRAAG